MKTTLLQQKKVNGQIAKYKVYPTSYADIVFLIKDDVITQEGVSIQTKIEELISSIASQQQDINLLNQKLTQQNYFKGYFSSLAALEDEFSFNELQYGDYAIVTVSGAEDKLYIFDKNDNAWREKGDVAPGMITSVNSKIADAQGAVVITIDDIADLRTLLNSFATSSSLSQEMSKTLKYYQSWDSTKSYYKNDIVKYNNCLYAHVGSGVALGNTPVENTTDWELIANVDITMPTKTSDLTNDGDGVSYQEHDGYAEFDSTGDYIGYYVLISDTYTLVTSENKDTLSITAGTTKAYEYSPYATKQYVADNGGKIDTISVNGTPQTITNKNVDITVPTKVSDLTNDGDGTSAFATESYVNTNGGKIDTISVGGFQQTITNKNVDIAIAKTGNSAPTASIAADFLGQFYLLVDISNSVNNATYQCVAITEDTSTNPSTFTYTWVEMMRRVDVTELE